MERHKGLAPATGAPVRRPRRGVSDGEPSPINKFTWIDLPLMLLPGLIMVVLALSWRGHEAARAMAAWSLGVFIVFVAFYIGTRLLLPRSARGLVMAVVLVPAVLSFLVGGVSLAAGYAIWAFLSAPLFGILLGAAFSPRRRHWPTSAPVSA